MAYVGQDSSILQHLDLTDLSLYCAEEPLLGGLPFLILYGPSVRDNSTLNSSRVQAHIFCATGYSYFPRLTIAPNSPLYVAVQHLPQDLQGDEICRGLAICILNYFASLSDTTKGFLKEVASNQSRDGSTPAMFDEMHAAQLASNMVEAPNTSAIFAILKTSFPVRESSWIDMDFLLPPNSMTWTSCESGDATDVDDNGLPRINCGNYTDIVENLGQSSFLPTNKLRRAPSRPTTSNKMKTISTNGKLSVRKEMREFVSTESNFIGKLQSLAHTIAPLLAQACPPETHQKLFPPCLEEIIELHQSLYASVRAIFESTEADSMHDIESEHVVSDEAVNHVSFDSKEDSLGIAAFARILSKDFPSLQNSYRVYLSLSRDFPSHVSSLVKDKHSQCSEYVSEIGEQYLRSIVMEPVQRLPRYTLFIDTIIQYLPFSHPSRSSLLRSRDMISKICGSNDAEKATMLPNSARLGHSIANWPLRRGDLGRLILAVDASESQLPNDKDEDSSNTVVLLFPGTLVVARRSHETAMSALALMAEIDQPMTAQREASLDTNAGTGLIFDSMYLLADVAFLESSDASFLVMVAKSSQKPHQHLGLASRVFRFKAPYQGRTSRLLEEITKSNIEGRYPNQIRESQNWMLRCIRPESEKLGLLIAVTEHQNPAHPGGRPRSGAVRIFLNSDGNNDISSPQEPESLVSARLSIVDDGGIKIEAKNTFGKSYQQKFSKHQLQSALKALVKAFFLTDNLAGMQVRGSFYSKILEGLPLQIYEESSRRRTLRPKSPVKMISNMLGAVSNQSSLPSRSRTRAGTLDQAERATPFSALSDLRTAPHIRSAESPTKRIKLPSNEPEARNPSLVDLEETFAAYIVALRSRSGNVVGKILQARHSADELAVNELYNSLLEDPRRLDVAALVSVDVLFAAFEKFQRVAWTESMGPIMSSDMILQLRQSIGTQDARDFKGDFQQSLGEMSPQNRRAFAASLRLLADLLDAAGNDGDRGILIASFAEALVWTGDPRDCIMLFDRLTEDYDMFFEEVLHAHGKSASATNSWGKESSVKTNSVNSNTSSFRRRLGLTNLLQGPNADREEPESKVASIWRTLSKTGRNLGDAARLPNSSVTSLVRSRSTDTDPRVTSISRPVSRDRPPTAGSSLTSESSSRPQSSYSTAGPQAPQPDNKGAKAPSVLKKKRRSSLSDLPGLREIDISPSLRPLEPNARQRKQDRPGRIVKDQASVAPRTQTRLSPQRSGIPRLRSPESKENSPSPRALPTRPTLNAAEGVTISSHPRKTPGTPFSQLPAPRSGLSERPWPPNSLNIQPPHDKTDQPKSRVQSPQKTRQRPLTESTSELSGSAALQAELFKIGQELSSVSRPGSSGTEAKKSTPSNDLLSLSRRLDFLQQQVDALAHQPKSNDRTTSAEEAAKLKAAETKVQKLDELYQEANAENEALYDRFNSELGKILGRLRKGEGISELRSRLAESQADSRKLRAENAKLKREIVELKGQ